MSDFINLTCPTCGGKLQITPDIDRFACGHCGNEHIVKRGAGIVSLAPVVEGLKEVRSGVDRTSSELAIKRLQEEINSLKDQRDTERGSWYGSNYGWGFVAIIIFVLVTFVCFPEVTIYKTIMIIVTVVVTVSVLLYLGKQKKEAENEWANYDRLIRRKTKELEYHERMVSR